MKLSDFLNRIPESFAIEILDALPGPDRKDLVKRHGAKVKISTGTLRRADRMAKECKLLLNALRKSEDSDSKRTYLQGWLARRAEMIVAFLDAWEIQHTNGIVEDFDWVANVTAEQAKEALERITKENEELEPVAPLVYFAYLELPVTAEVMDLDEVWKSIEPAVQET